MLQHRHCKQIMSQHRHCKQIVLQHRHGKQVMGKYVAFIELCMKKFPFARQKGK
jgi:hypothetical protein